MQPEERGWRRCLPWKWPGLWRRWRQHRREYFEDITELVKVLEEEADYDFEDVDEFGDPRKRVYWTPKSFRRWWRFLMLAYYDPLVEFGHSMPSILLLVRWVVRLLPIAAFLVALGWLGVSVWTNMQYEEGDCAVEKLPELYASGGDLQSSVEADYTVKRSIPGTRDRAAGHVIAICKVTVTCHEMHYGTTHAADDDRCVSFGSWAWGDQMVCYYHKDDFYGTKAMEVFCLDRPSDLKQETLSCIVAGIVLLLSCLLSAIFEWRRRDMLRQARLMVAEAAAEAAEAEEAKRELAEREEAEASRQRELLQPQHGEDLDVDDEVDEDGESATSRSGSAVT